MKKEKFERHVDTNSKLVFSTENEDPREEATIATPEDIAAKLQADIKKVARYNHRQLSFLPKPVTLFKRKHIN